MNTQNNGLFNFNHIPSNLANIPSNISNIVSGLISNANKSNNEGDSAVSVENKRQRAKALVSTFENYKKASPFHTGFLRSIAQKFQNFFSWLFRKNPSFPLSSIEMQFAMQLYRTCDAQLLTKIENEKKIPFSYILESWAHFLKELDPGKSSNEHVALKKCAEYQKSIESARLNSHPVWRKASIYFLQRRISRAIDQLQIDQSILIPGGYLSKGLKDLETNRTEMLYEVRRTNAGYTFRIFHNSDAIGIEKVEKSYALKKDQIFAHLNEILELQAICDTSENERGLFKVINEYGGYALTLFKLRKAPKNLNTLTSVAKNAIDKSIYTSSESRFKNLLLKLRDYTRPINQNANAAKLSPNKSDEKVTEIFFTCKNPEQATIQKLGMKLSVLFDLFDKTKSYKQKDEKFSIWLRDNAIHLTKTIDRKIGDCDDLKGIKGKLNEIVEEFSHSVQEIVLLPPAPDKQKSNPNIFSDPLIFLQEDIPVSSFSKLKAKSIGTLSPLPVEEQTFENLLSSCKSLSEGKKFDLLRLRLNDAYHTLFHLDQDAEHWKGLSILDREEWSEKIVELVKYSAQINFANDEKAPIPHYFYQMVKSFEICQRLAWLNDEKTKFNDFHFDMFAIRDVLKDPYLDLGHTGPDLLSALDQIEGDCSNLVGLTTSRPVTFPEQKFYLRHVQNLSFQEEEELYTDLGDKNLLPKNIVHLRQMSILLRMVTARYRTLDYPGVWNKAKALAGGFVKYVSEIIAKKENPSLGLIPGYVRKIDENLEKIEAPKSFFFAKPYLMSIETPRIEPYGLHLIEYQSPPFSSRFEKAAFVNTDYPSLYKGTGAAIHTAGISDRIIEGIVSNQDDDEAYENGTSLPPSAVEAIHPGTGVKGKPKVYTYGPAGNKKTERTILDEKFRFQGQQFDVSADLQLMQTAPLITRIQNTLGTFVKNSGLLADPKSGYEWQRVMSLNLFRNGALHQFFKHQPQYRESIATSLMDISKQLEYNGKIEGVLFMIGVIEQSLQLMQTDPAAQPLRKYLDELLATLTVWHGKTDEDITYKQYRREIHQAYLLHFANHLKEKLQDLTYDVWNDPEVKDHLPEILKSHFVTQQIPELKERINRTNNESIRYMMYRLFPAYQVYLNDEKSRNDLLNSVVKSLAKEDLKWDHKNGSTTCHSDKWAIDIQKGLIYIDNVAKCPLPTQITNDPLCKQVFGDHLQKLVVDHWIAGTKEKEGQVYEFKQDNHLYRILSIPGENPIIYKLRRAKTLFLSEKWDQLHLVTMSYSQEEKEKGVVGRMLSTLSRYLNETPMTNQQIIVELNKQFKEKNAPCVLSQYHFWVSESGKEFRVESEKGELLFTGKTEVKNSTAPSFKWPYALKKFEGKNSLGVLNPWSDPSFQKFVDLDRPSQILATGAKSRVDNVKYHRFDLEYRWNRNSKKWQSSSHRGYFLSDKKGEELLKFKSRGGANDHKVPTLFASTFTNYHLLEHSTKLAKLLVVGEEYKKVERPLIPKSPTTHIRKIVEPKRSNTGSDITEMYTFDIDPVQGLKTKSAEGYLYLAYLLFTQSKYTQAIYYLRKAQDIRPKISENTEKILGWFENWKSDSPRVKTVLMHVQILKLEQLKTLHTKPPLTIETQNVLKNAMATYKDYQKWVKENKIDQTLYLSPKERNDLFYVCQEISNQIKSIIEQLGERAGISQEGQAFFHSIEEFIENFLRENQEGDNILTNEIEQLKRQIKINIDHAAAKGANVKVENETNFESPVFENVDQILIKKSENKAGNLVSHQILDLETEFSKYEGYTNELGKELITDVQIALNKQQESEYQFVKEINFNKLRADLKVKNDQLDKEVQEKKRAILSSFVLKSIPAGSLDEIKRNLKEEDATKEKFFDEALFAYGANNWKELLDQYVIHQGQIEELDRLIEDFLITATKKQQYGKSLVLIEEFLQNPADTVVANQLITLLNTKRYYNPMSDAYKRACLMLEYDSKIIARKSQIQNVHDMLKQENLFKHEALAGGKTTVLRNIITKIKADGINLSGIITHDALIEMHHALFRNTTTNAYGDKAIRFEFCRKDPSDLIALKALLRNLLKTVANHGRIDMTKKDALSFHHSYLMKFEELLKGQRVDEINQEIDLMNEIFLLLREHCCIGSDEMDKVCDPEKEHNYATGEKVSIDPVKRDAAFEMVKWILTDNKSREIFTGNTQYRLMEQGGNVIRKWIAGKIRNKYLPHTNLDEAVHYFTGLGEGDSNGYYNSHIANNPNKSSLKAFQKYLSEVIGGTLQQRNGVTFGRSKDLFLVKPFESNGECAENSEHGTEEELIWYTCMSYMDQTLGGVLADQVSQLVIEEQNKASKSVLQSQKINPQNPIDYERTPQAIRFMEEFKLNLRQITSSDYPKIAKSINDDPNKLVEFMESRVFSQMTLRREKIVGNSSDLVNLFKEFYGSSGTSNICQALPSKIIKDPALIKQPGVDGAVVLALLKDFKQGDIIELKEGQDLATQIIAQLGSKNGSALIDLAPAFPGKLAKEIVLELSHKIEDKTNQFCFIDKDDTVQMYDATSKIAVAAKDNPNLDAATTIFDKGHTRGTDLVLSNHSIGYVTISADTKYSDFLQAVMRMRKLGKGQKVRYLIDSGVKKRLNNQNSLGNLIAMAIDNEAKGLKKLHLKSEKQAIKSIPKSAIFFNLHSVPKMSRAEVWADVRKFFVYDTQESLDSIGQPKQLEKSPIVLKELANKELEKLAAITTLPLSNLEKARQELTDKAEGRTLIKEIYLPSHTFKGSFDQEMQQEVEKEQEQEQEQEMAQEQEQEQVLSGTNDKGISWYEFGVNSISHLVAELKREVDFHRLNSPESVPFYDDNIYYTKNFSRRDFGLKIWGSERINEKLPPKQMRHSRFVIIVDKNSKEIYTVLGTAKDFDHVFENLNVEASDFDFYIYNLNRDDLDGKIKNWEDYENDLQEKIVRSIVQVKLLNGEIDLLKPEGASLVIRQEYNAFKNFLMEKTAAGLMDPKLVQANLRKYLAMLRPTHASEYASSTMAKAFKECIPVL